MTKKSLKFIFELHILEREEEFLKKIFDVEIFKVYSKYLNHTFWKGRKNLKKYLKIYDEEILKVHSKSLKYTFWNERKNFKKPTERDHIQL